MLPPCLLLQKPPHQSVQLTNFYKSTESRETGKPILINRPAYINAITLCWSCNIRVSSKIIRRSLQFQVYSVDNQMHFFVQQALLLNTSAANYQKVLEIKDNLQELDNRNAYGKD